MSSPHHFYLALREDHIPVQPVIRRMWSHWAPMPGRSTNPLPIAATLVLNKRLGTSCELALLRQFPVQVLRVIHYPVRPLVHFPVVFRLPVATEVSSSYLHGILCCFRVQSYGTFPLDTKNLVFYRDRFNKFFHPLDPYFDALGSAL